MAKGPALGFYTHVLGRNSLFVSQPGPLQKVGGGEQMLCAPFLNKWRN